MECSTRFYIRYGKWNANNAPIITNLIRKFPISDIFVAKNNFPTNLLDQNTYTIRYYTFYLHIIDILNFDSQSTSHITHATLYTHTDTHTLRIHVHIQRCDMDSPCFCFIHSTSMGPIDGWMDQKNKKSVNWKFNFPNSRPRISSVLFALGDGINL